MRQRPSSQPTVDIADSDSWRFTNMTGLAHVAFFLSGFIRAYSQGAEAIHFPFGLICTENHTLLTNTITKAVELYNNNTGRDRHHTSHKLEVKKKTMNTHNDYYLIENMCRFYSEGVLAMLGYHTVEELPTLTTYATTFHVPYVTVGATPPRPPTPTHEGAYMFHIRPLPARALADVILELGWDRVYYMYDSVEGLLLFDHVKEALFGGMQYVQMDIRHVTSAHEAKRVVQKLIAPDGKNKNNNNHDLHIILDLQTSIVVSLLDRFAVTNGSHIDFLLARLNIQELPPRLSNRREYNLYGYRILNPTSSAAKRFVQALGPSQRESLAPGGVLKYEAALVVDAVNVVGEAVRTLNLMYSDPRNLQISCDPEPREMPYGEKIRHNLEQVDIPDGLTGRVAFDSSGLRRDFSLQLLESKYFTRVLTQTGTWDSRIGLNRSESKIIPVPTVESPVKRRVIITSIETPPFLENIGNETHPNYVGFCSDLARYVADFLNVTYTLKTVDDGSYGAQNENGTWDGMVGEVMRGVADMAIADLTITSKREKVVQFSKPFMSLGISIMIKRPNKGTSGVFSFMYPLSYETWMCVIFAFVGVGVVLFLVSRFSPVEWTIEDSAEGSQLTNNYTVVNSLWFALAAIMQQGCDFEPRSTGGRAATSVWWFFTLIIISSYTANLAAFLTMERMNTPIESADDLAKQTEIKYGAVKGGTTESFFKTSALPLYQRMWTFMKSNSDVFMKSNSDGIKRVRASNGKYAFLVESTTNEYQSLKAPCDTVKVGRNLDSKGYGIATSRDSELSENITLAVLSLRENGTLFRLKQKYFSGSSECQADKESKGSTSALEMSHVAGSFYILGAGLGLALGIALIEFLHKAVMEAKRLEMPLGTVMMSVCHLPIKGVPLPAQQRDTSSSQLQEQTECTYTPQFQADTLMDEIQGTTSTQV